MSSPDHTTRRAALFALGLLPALMLGGCFRPMYAQPDNAAPGLTERLAAIGIHPTPNDRIGQQIRNKLSFDLTGGGDAPTPRYMLNLSTSAFGDTALIDALNNAPEVATITVTCDFTLQDPQTKRILFKAKANARKSYDSGLQRFSALRAERDAENSTAEVLADQIRTRIAIYLANHP